MTDEQMTIFAGRLVDAVNEAHAAGMGAEDILMGLASALSATGEKVGMDNNDLYHTFCGFAWTYRPESIRHPTMMHRQIDRLEIHP